MIEQEILSQLKGHFTGLAKDVTFELAPSEHDKAGELEQFLAKIASTSERISLVEGKEGAETPQFRLLADGHPTGIAFHGIPSGHEFTSLVVAILNAGGVGRMPDEAMTQRIRRLQGPYELKTYVSLSCENCPDVVQALNQVALIHPDLSHVMVDGALHQKEVEQLNLQGVPAVVWEGDLIHSGKGNLATLLEKLEEKLGVSGPLEAVSLEDTDVAVIGGGPAGVAAAVYLARKGLNTSVICDQLGGQVADTKGIENSITLSYTEGPELTQSLGERLRQNGVRLYENRRVQGIEPGERHLLQMSGGESIKAKQVIVATGAQWRKLGVPGEEDYIGRGVAFCPHCDGPYYKGKRVVVVGGGNSGVEAAIDLAGITEEVTLLEYASELKADAVLVRKLQSLPNVKIIRNAKTTEVVGDGQKVVGLSYEDREDGEKKVMDTDGIFVQIGLSPNSAPFKGLLEMNRFGEIEVDGKGQTSVPGIFAAGDVTTTPFKQIVIAMGEGAKAALGAFEVVAREIEAS